MSFQLSRATWSLLGMPPAKKVVLAYLADRADQDGRCWPSVRTISECTGLCKRAVNDALTWLEADGALTRTRRSQANVHEVNVYLVTPQSSRCPLRPARGNAPDAVGSAPGAVGGAYGAEGSCTTSSTLVYQVQWGSAGDAYRSINEQPEDNQENNQEKQQGGAGARRKSMNPSSASSRDTIAVFDHWRLVMDHPGAKLDSKRVKVVGEALKLGYTLDQLKQAIDGCRCSPWHMGANNDKRVYDSLGLILRNGEKIDQFIALATRPKPMMSPAAMQTANAGQRWLSEQSALHQEIDRAA